MTFAMLPFLRVTLVQFRGLGCLALLAGTAWCVGLSLLAMGATARRRRKAA